MIERKLPAEGGRYKDFAGKMYQVIRMAKDAGTQQPMVVYQAQDDEQEWYVRSLKEFQAEYRNDPEEELQEETELTDGKEKVREEILRFLDAESAEEKLKVLRELKRNLDEELLTTIELSMDLLPDDKESWERRVSLVEQTLEKRIRFEGSRLR